MKNEEKKEFQSGSAVLIKSLSKSFQTGSVRTEVLKNLDLKIRHGEFCAVMGASGCGKSTLMSIISGLETPDSGICMVNGREISRLSDRELARYRNQEIGIIFQGFYLDETRNLIENVAMPLGYAGVAAKERKERATELLRRFGLYESRKKRPSQISGGEQQRAAIARAIVNRPELLLADEPTGNLDAQNTKNVMSILTQLHEEGRTIIMVTHDEEVASYADRIIRMGGI